MRNSTFLKSLFLLCALIVGSGTAWAADKWVKTAPADLKTDDVVVIVDQTSVTAMSNDKGTSSAPAATAVTLNGDKSEITSSVGETLQWVVTVTDGSYQFGVAGTEKFLYCINSNNGVRVGTNDNNAFTITQGGDDDADFLVNTATSRYLGVFNEQDWRCYGSINANIKATVTAFYKKTSNVDPSKKDIKLSFPTDSYQADIADGTTSFTAPTVSATPAVTGITYTYSSSNEAVATVNENGAVTLVKKGTTTITASFAGNETYNPAEASYTLTVTNSNANDGSETKPFTVEEALEETPATGTSENYYIKGIVSGFYRDDIISDGSNYRYYISDDGTETNQLLVYKGKGLNNVAFTAATDLEIGDEVVILGGLTTYNSTKEIAANNYIVSRKTKADPALTVEENVELYVGQQKAVSKFYLIEDDYAGVMSFESSDETVAKVEGDVLKALAVGTAVITVTAAADANYKAATATFTVTVKSMDVTPEGSNAGAIYQLVTDDTSLSAGDKFIVVCTSKNMVMGAQSGTKCENVEVTITDNTVTGDNLPAGAKVVTLESATGGWYLKTDQGYLTSTAAKSIKVEAEKTEASIVTISIDAENNDAVIDFGTAGTLQYNASSPRFCTYTSGQTPVQIYRYTETNTFDITIKAGFDGYRTLVSAVDAMLPEGLKAYIVTKVESGTASGTATLTEVPTIKANTPYILKGTAGQTYTLTGAEGVPDPEGNLLKISDSNTGYGVYVLAKPAGKEIGFYKWTGGSLGAGRVYLDTTTAAPDFIGFSSETTGIAAVTNNAQTTTGWVYNLQGQRVSQPTKGLFIVNGKKVVVK